MLAVSSPGPAWIVHVDRDGEAFVGARAGTFLSRSVVIYSPGAIRQR